MNSEANDHYTELDLIRLIEDIIRGLPDSHLITQRSPTFRDPGFDIAFDQDTHTYLVDVRNVVPQTALRLKQIQRQLSAARASFNEQSPGHDVRLVLATPGVIAEQKMNSLDLSDFEIWDREWITQHVAELGITGGIADTFGREDRQAQGTSEKQNLEDSLRGTSCGSAQWSNYQRLCSNIFEYLFSPPLESPIYESLNESRVNRRNFVMPNYAIEGFWHFMRSHYKADYLVVDAKNYCDPIGKEEVLQLANYLSQHGTGLFGLIVTRVGIDSAGSYTCREQWILHNKMIITLGDDDLLQVTGQVLEISFGFDQVTAGIQGSPSASMIRASKKARPCLAAVDR
jgi:hypothetical protein